MSTDAHRLPIPELCRPAGLTRARRGELGREIIPAAFVRPGDGIKQVIPAV